MISKTTKTLTVRIWMAGNYDDAERICRKFCSKGMCVSIHPTNYIYTGGEEMGFCVTLINYARFPEKTIAAVKHKALTLAYDLMEGLYQQSFSIEDPENTTFYSSRPEDRTPQAPITGDPWEGV